MTYSHLTCMRLRFRLVLAAVFLLGLVLPAAAADGAKKTYDLPADEAVAAFKRFSQQSGRELIYPASAVEGVRTQAVRGDFTATEALHQMLEGTDLFAVEDQASGAFAINRAASPNDQRVAQEETSDHPEQQVRIEDGKIVMASVEVTGQRIDGLNNRGLLQGGADAPVYQDIISRQDIERLGISSLEELLRYLPQTSSASTPMQVPEGNTFTSGGLTPSYSTVGLRGFDSAQTVVLVNGRALPRTGLFDNSGADLSRIPLAAIDRIEILPSSASAIFGAGALGGAINIILRKEYTGRDLTTYLGTSTEGGATEYRFTYLQGDSFNAGRTRLTLTLSYHHRDGLRANQRDYLDEALRRYGPNSTAANAQGQTYFEQYILPAFAAAPGTILVGTGSSQSDLGIPGSPGVRYAAIPAGTTPAQATQLTPADFTATAGTANLAPRYGRTILYEPLTSYSLNAVLEHEFIPKKLSGYSEFTVGKNRRDYTMPQGLSITLDANDPANPFRTGVTPGFVGRPINIYLDTPDLPDSHIKFDYDSVRLVAGLKGNVNERWEWSFDGTLDYTDNTVDSDDPLSNLTELLKPSPYSDPGPAAPVAQRRAIYEVLADHSKYPVSSDVVANYFHNTRHSYNRGLQKEVNARVMGQVFNLPAGPLRTSLAAKYQNWTFDSGQYLYGSDGYSQLINNAPLDTTPSGSTASRSINYGVVELSIPVFGKAWRPVPFVEGLELQGSVSREDDRTRGVNDAGHPFLNLQSANSSVAAAKLQFTPDIAVRFSYSEGFYPPNWADVSMPTNTFTLPGFFPDPKRGNTMQFTPMMTIMQGGNPDLEPETATSKNVGLIFTPRFLPHFTLNVDGWRIEKTNAIVFQSFVDIIANPDAFGFLITREAPTAADTAQGWLGRITAVDARAFNASITRTEGVDVRANYIQDLDQLGRLGFTAMATFTNYFDLLATPTAPVVNTAGGSGPIRWRGNLSVSWQRNRWSATVTGRYVGHRSTPTTDPSPSYPGAYPIDGGRLPAFLRTDLQVSYEQPYAPDSKNWFQGTKWTLGVLNVANTKPTFVTNGTGFYNAVDDPRQRFVYVQIKKSL